MTHDEKQKISMIPELMKRIVLLEAKVQELEAKKRPGRPRKNASTD